ncbi:MAG TPA: lipocalin family protein [Bacteroidales bacterium]|nr:lipocalin family protein [Bacteroidales bacterium]OQB71445.1 MAG: Outer membrane lipoprotein Blc precursor [Bacteroidetes bacterium ADurb.Bin139]HOG25892.1 lipocalin family protein [Bacteroidales bacterium]HOR10878.1 lipocalin family protein [Bacteroidales bacterium]HOZ19029.1 lipocalin family protein [Bacteroidales bacterium]
MRKIHHSGLLLFFCILFLTCTGCVLEEPTIAGKNTLQHIDLASLMGHWDEIGQWGRPEPGKVAAVSVDLSLDDKYLIHINIKKNKYTPYGPLKERKGKVKWNPDYAHIVKCALFLNYYQSYYILYLDPDHKTTLICNKRKTKLLVYSKEPPLSYEQIERISKAMQDNGFDPEKFNWYPTYF